MSRRFERFGTLRGHVAVASTVPTFMIIGAQRCGTTSLFRLIQSHPDVVTPHKKELHYFDNKYVKGINWYLSQFPASAALGPAVSGEATPYYLYHPLCAERIKQQCPDVKLIVVLRNPIDRAFSHYKWAVAKGNESLDFAAALNAEDARLANSDEQLLAGGTNFSHQKHSYRSRGLYAQQLEVWFERFPRSQFLILKSENLFANPQAEMDQVWRFLGLEPYLVEKLPAQKTSSEEALPLGLREELNQFYRPHNRRLAQLLQWDLDWS